MHNKLYRLWIGSSETDNLTLPLALLLANTDLPLAEAILSLNPCLLRRFLLEGWYVLFITDMSWKTKITILCNFLMHYK